MTPILQKAELNGACARFVWSDGFAAEFACVWLLDNAVSARTHTGGQRARSAQSLVAAGPLRSIAVDGDRVLLEFARENLEWSGTDLREQAQRATNAPEGRVLWHAGADIAARPAISYKAYLDDDATLERALSDVGTYGLVRLADAGTDEIESEWAVARFGYIRETNYGRLFEVRIEPSWDHLANTARALEPHTDNPYRDPAPTLQLLHCIRNAGEGGATFFLDGFALAEWLLSHHAVDFTRLARHAVPFAFTNAAGERYEARSPVLRLDAEGRLSGIRFNHRSLGSVDLGAEETARWYESYMTIAREAESPARHLPLTMPPGDMVLFDNERILHGRTAFSGERLLKGCYSDRDGLFATLARLRQRGTPSNPKQN